MSTAPDPAPSTSGPLPISPTASLPLPQATHLVGAPMPGEGPAPALLCLYNQAVRSLVGPLITAISVICAVCPPFRQHFHVPENVLKPDGTYLRWIPQGYGTSSSKVPLIPVDSEHVTGLYHAACTYLVALFKDSRDNSHIKAAEGRFAAFKAAANISVTHTPYPQIDTSSFVAWMSAQTWAHSSLITILSTPITGPGAHLMTQMHLVAKDAQMTTLNAIDTFLKEFDSALILIPGVVDDIPKFQRAWQELASLVSSTWFPYVKATMHPQAKKISPSSFPKLASAALYHAVETNPTMRMYRQNKPIPGGIPESRLKAAFQKKLKRAEAEIFTDEQRDILQKYGVTASIIERTLRKQTKKRSHSPDTSEMDT
ncbi:N [Southwest carpet python virus]|uniref:N n=1 Tax=Southwest carpet python virus TaxID=2016402 RepID=A0A2K8MNI4_9MONO|nr:N [Southwest carpet python virus] [Southwest carpet python virus]ATY47620.1 N [Southwest carpet python virus] [Southwest carpet python virus]